MKWVVGAICWGLTNAAHAVTVDRLSYSGETDILRVYATYAGGCREHVFTLQLEGCDTTLPARASAQLFDDSADDSCGGKFKRILQYDMRNLTCRPAFLTVRGNDSSKQTIFIK